MSSSKKLNLRRLFTYIFVVSLLVLARPQSLFYWTGFAISMSGALLRLWACGYLHKNKTLACAGPYAHLKHPLYMGTFLGFSGLIIGTAGTGGQRLLLPAIALPVFLLVFFINYMPRKNRIEKDRMARRFGEEFTAWDQEVPDFLPRLRPYRSADPPPFNWGGLVRNSEVSMFLVFMAGWTVLFCRLT